jgi:ArsR family transcriptional regulator, arsenate/arsenite/antimonite-responsive transcriptional repressor
MATNLAELERPQHRLADGAELGDQHDGADQNGAHGKNGAQNGAHSEDSYRFPELSEQLEKDLVQVFKLLSDETRLRILLYLARERELHVTALCEKLGQSQPAVSHHLALLRVAGLIEARRDGKHNFYSVRKSHFHRLMGELFQSISDPETDQVRFDDFVLTQDNA